MNDQARLYRIIATLLAGIGAAALFLSTFIYWRVLGPQGVSTTSTDWGTFGDFVSGIAGTIIALATLIALAVTLHLQAKEMAAARDLLARQSYALSKQNFENTFFRILEFINAIAERVNDPNNANAPMGRQYFSIWAKLLRQSHMTAEIADRAVAAAEVVVFFERYGTGIEPYFQLVSQALQRIDGSNMNRPEVYASILRATLTAPERFLIFCRSIADDDLRGLVCKYRIVERHEIEEGRYRVSTEQVEWVFGPAGRLVDR